MVDLHTVRYSVPHQLVRDSVDVVADLETVRIFHGARLVATHARSSEPFARVIDPAHYPGLWRPTLTPVADAAPLAALGRALTDYAAVIAGGAQHGSTTLIARTAGDREVEKRSANSQLRSIVPWRVS
jgi:hypothetical protein